MIAPTIADQKTPGIKAGYTYTAYRVENEPSNESPDDAEHKVEDGTLAVGVDDLARDKSAIRPSISQPMIGIVRPPTSL
jgi:hypothetical protein